MKLLFPIFVILLFVCGCGGETAAPTTSTVASPEPPGEVLPPEEPQPKIWRDTVRIPLTFALGELDTDERLLKKITAEVAELTKQHAGWRMVVRGHLDGLEASGRVDSRARPNEAVGPELSLARAELVADSLRAAGIADSLLTVENAGGDFPVDGQGPRTSKPLSEHLRDRRVEIILLPAGEPEGN